MRRLTECSRDNLPGYNLFVVIEAADMVLPTGGDLASLKEKQAHSISVAQDWFSNPAFMNGEDSVILVAESRSLVHPRVSRLPQVLKR